LALELTDDSQQQWRERRVEILKSQLATSITTPKAVEVTFEKFTFTNGLGS